MNSAPEPKAIITAAIEGMLQAGLEIKVTETSGSPCGRALDLTNLDTILWQLGLGRGEGLATIEARRPGGRVEGTVVLTDGGGDLKEVIFSHSPALTLALASAVEMAGGLSQYQAARVSPADTEMTLFVVANIHTKAVVATKYTRHTLSVSVGDFAFSGVDLSNARSPNLGEHRLIYAACSSVRAAHYPADYAAEPERAARKRGHFVAGDYALAAYAPWRG